MSEEKVRDIGVDVQPPKKICNDNKCPFHGELSVRGQVLRGTVISTKMDGSVVVKKDYLHYIPKYERYEKRSSNYPAHLPECIDVEAGDEVSIMECRPLSKSISFVVIDGGQKE
ncbi:MAG: 30S ribosomal protein S17 [Candidatus Saliniplasma sp.]